GSPTNASTTPLQQERVLRVEEHAAAARAADDRPPHQPREASRGVASGAGYRPRRRGGTLDAATRPGRRSGAAETAARVGGQLARGAADAGEQPEAAPPPRGPRAPGARRQPGPVFGTARSRAPGQAHPELG